VSNAEVKRRTGCQPLSEFIRSRRLRLFGHIARAGRKCIITVLFMPPSTNLHGIGKGRAHTWTRTFEADLEPCNIGLQSSKALRLIQLSVDVIFLLHVLHIVDSIQSNTVYTVECESMGCILGTFLAFRIFHTILQCISLCVFYTSFTHIITYFATIVVHHVQLP